MHSIAEYMEFILRILFVSAPFDRRLCRLLLQSNRKKINFVTKLYTFLSLPLTYYFRFFFSCSNRIRAILQRCFSLHGLLSMAAISSPFNIFLFFVASFNCGMCKPHHDTLKEITAKQSMRTWQLSMLILHNCSCCCCCCCGCRYPSLITKMNIRFSFFFIWLTLNYAHDNAI